MMAAEDNHPGEARVALEKVLQLNPKSPVGLQQLGELELADKDYAKAGEHLKAAGELRPDAATSFHAGQALVKSGDLERARAALEASLKANAGQLPARLLLGEVYLQLKNAAAADDQFEAALLVDSNNLEAQIGAAKAQVALGQFSNAVQQLESLSRSQSANPEVFELLAKAYAGNGNKPAALRAENRARLLRAKK